MQMCKTYGLYGFLLLSCVAYAAPVLRFEQNTMLFNMQRCIDDSAKDCIKASCIAYAPMNCTSQCKELARNKCKAIAGQWWLPMDLKP